VATFVIISHDGSGSFPTKFNEMTTEELNGMKIGELIERA
jgi:hypothetical protein